MTDAEFRQQQLEALLAVPAIEEGLEAPQLDLEVSHPALEIDIELGVERLSAELVQHSIALELRGGGVSSGGGTVSPYWIASLIDLVSPNFYYYGGSPVAGWKINRWGKDSYIKQSATIVNNPGYVTLGEAWGDRLLLVYGEV